MSILSKKDCLLVLDMLLEAYPGAACALEHGSVFELLVAVVLSAQTTDKSVNAVTPELFGKYPDADALAVADEDDLRLILRRAGMYRTKARNIKSLAVKLVTEYGGRTPENYDELVKLPGVGRKSANVVLSAGFGQQRIAVDTHVFRVANRIGLCDCKDVLKTELALMERLPENRWSEAHYSMISHGRNRCRARNPECGACEVNGYCVHLASGKGCLPGGGL
jgi:endonuclease-3